MNSLLFGSVVLSLFSVLADSRSHLMRRLLDNVHPDCASFTNCASCVDDGTNVYCTHCDTGYFTTEWNSACFNCEETFDGCDECTHNSGCTACKDGYIYHWSNDDQANICSLIHQCVNNCDKCNNGGGSCETCSVGYWKDEWDGDCLSCNVFNNCQTCQDSNGCIDCQSGYWQDEYAGDCLACNDIDNCNNCEDYNGCIECQTGFTLKWNSDLGYRICD